MKPSSYLRLETKTNPSTELGSPYPVINKEQCPKCRDKGRDKRGNNLICYSNNGKHCFACGYTIRGDNEGMTSPITNNETNSSIIDTLNYDPSVVMSDRGIISDSFKKYGVQVTDDIHVYPYFGIKENTLIGTKTRYVKTKQFKAEGAFKGNNLMLFGQQLFPKGCSKSVILHEGELDAISSYQMLSGRYPCLSVPNGASAAAKSVTYNYAYLDSFDTIYLCFDNDDAGKEATSEVAKMFTPGKVKIISLPANAKDSNDVLFKLNDAPLFVRCVTNASTWTPSGIRHGSSLLGDILNKARKPATPYPWDGLNKTLKGIRSQELVTVTAGSGQGKSSVMRELAYHLFNNTVDNIGMIYLEESNAKTGESLLSMAVNKPLHLIKDEYIGWDGQYISEEKGKEWESMINAGYEKVLNNERFSFFDHFGSTDLDTIINCVRYMATALGSKFIFLDHLSIIVSSQENGDERKAIDEVVTKLRQLVQETDITLFMVSHLKRTDDSHEEGGKVSLSHLRGSQGIQQISDVVIAIERDQQAEDKDVRNTTIIRVLKARETGLTGPCAALYYNRDTGRLEEVDLEDTLARIEESKAKRKSKKHSEDENELGEVVSILKGAGGFKKIP